MCIVTFVRWGPKICDNRALMKIVENTPDTVSGFDQGRAAGEITRVILLEGRSPAGYPMKSTEKGIPVINLARARKLNLNPTSSVLLTAEVITGLPE